MPEKRPRRKSRLVLVREIVDTESLAGPCFVGTHREVFDCGPEPPVFVYAENGDVGHFRIVEEVRGPRADRLGLALPRTGPGPVVPLDHRLTALAGAVGVTGGVILPMV